MNTYILVLGLILVLAVISLSLPTKCNSGDDVEGFYTYFGYYKNYCNSCGDRSRFSCSKCSNCTLCVTPSGREECVAGGPDGAYFRNDCQYVSYSDPYMYYPNSHLYPVIQTRSLYPYNRFRVSRPWKWTKRR